MKISGVALGELECERKNETLDVLFRLPIDRICEEHIKRLEAEIDKLKCERDAAVRDLSLNANCTVCNNYAKCKDWMAMRCAGFIDAGNSSPFFEWRGVCAENSGGDEYGTD